MTSKFNWTVEKSLDHLKDLQEGPIHIAFDPSSNYSSYTLITNGKSTDKVEMSAKERFLEEKRKEAEEVKLQQMRTAYDLLGDDEYEIGTVIRFNKMFDRTVKKEGDYTTWWYAAIKRTDGKWSLTGGSEMSSPRGVTWEDLRIWMATTGIPTSEFKVMK